MDGFSVAPVGVIRADDERFEIRLNEGYAPALKGLEGFGYIQVIWWFNGLDDAASRANLVEHKPYKNGPDELGAFATRSPKRPNPIAVSCARVIGIDALRGVIRLAYIDAFDQSPVLDIKPYTPSLDRVETPIVPEWCADWPMSCEASGEFDWGNVFNF